MTVRHKQRMPAVTQQFEKDNSSAEIELWATQTNINLPNCRASNA
jgi:hypothetical protein